MNNSSSFFPHQQQNNTTNINRNNNNNGKNEDSGGNMFHNNNNGMGDIALDCDSGVLVGSRMYNGNNSNSSSVGNTMGDGHIISFKLQSGNTTFYGMDLLCNENSKFMNHLLESLKYQCTSGDSLNNCKPNYQECNQFKLEPDYFGEKRIWFVQGKKLYLPVKLNE